MPGGHIEKGEDILEGLHREVYEECGIKVDIDTMVGIYLSITSPCLIFSFFADYKSGELRCSDESTDFAWLSYDNLITRIDSKVVKQRATDFLNFKGKIKYRVYTKKPYKVLEEHFLDNLSPMK